MMKKGILLLILLLVSAGSILGQSAEQEIRSMLDERDAEIKELLGPEGNQYTQDQRDRLKDIINNIIDYRSMARQALGETFQEITDEERNEFVDLFSTIIRDNSLNRLDIYRAEVSYNEISVNGDSASVETTAQLDNVRTSVDYSMHRENDGWMITDMSIDQVSTADSYNRQFQNIIRRHGFDALMESLQRRASRSST